MLDMQPCVQDGACARAGNERGIRSRAGARCSTGWLQSHTSTSKSALSNANTLLSQDCQCSQHWVKTGRTETPDWKSPHPTPTQGQGALWRSHRGWISGPQIQTSIRPLLGKAEQGLLHPTDIHYAESGCGWPQPHLPAQEQAPEFSPAGG